MVVLVIWEYLYYGITGNVGVLHGNMGILVLWYYLYYGIIGTVGVLVIW